MEIDLGAIVTFASSGRAVASFIVTASPQTDSTTESITELAQHFKSFEQLQSELSFHYLGKLTWFYVFPDLYDLRVRFLRLLIH